MTSGPVKLALIAVFVALSIACSRRAPEAPRVPLDAAEIEAALDEVQRSADSVRRYQGFVRIRGQGPDGGFSGRLVVIFERPERFRIELLGAFGVTRWAAVAGPSGIKVVFPGPGQYVEEVDTADVVGRLLGIRLGPDEVMALLSGAGASWNEASPSEAYRQGETRVVRSPSGERLELSDDAQVVSAQTSRYRVRYPSEWKKRRRQIPDRLELETELLEATLTVEAVDVNVALDPEAFAVEVPAGATRLRPADVAGEAVFVASPSNSPRR